MYTRAIAYPRFTRSFLDILFVAGMVMMCLLVLSGSVHAAQVTLGWSSNPEADVAGYKLYYGTQSRTVAGSYSFCSNVGDTTTYTIEGLDSGTVYYVAATAYNQDGTESDYSSEITVTTPALDSDGDGISDWDESNIYGTDPLKSDTDGDGASDGDELSYWGDNWNGDADDDGIINLLDPEPYTAPVDGSSLLALGQASIDSSWQTVILTSNFTNPVVIVGAPTDNDLDPGVVRLENVYSDSFDIRFEEWLYQDDLHDMEQVAYMVAEAGRHVLDDGTIIEAGSFTLDGTGTFASVSFSGSFPSTPNLFLSIQTHNSSDPVTARAKNLTASGFQAALFEEEAKMDGHGTEKVGYIAVYTSSGSGYLMTESNGLGFETSIASIGHDFILINNYQVKVEEEQSADEETEHSEETVSLLLVSQYLFAQDISCAGSDTVTPRYAEMYASRPAVDFEADVSSGPAPLGVQFYSMTEGLVYSYHWNFGDGSTSTAQDPNHVYQSPGLYTVTLTATTANGQESNVKSNYVTVSSQSGPEMTLGQISIDHSWQSITLPTSFTNPVVIAGPPSANGSDGGAVRLQQVDGRSFAIRYQEWLYLDGWHTTESVPYLVVESGHYELADGTIIEAGTFSAEGTGSWSSQTFTSSFPSTPVLLLTVQTYNGGETVTARARNVSATGFQAALFEEEAKMNGHIKEQIGYLAIYNPNQQSVVTIDGSSQEYTLDHASVSSALAVVGNVRLVLQEEQSKDWELGHNTESIAVLSFGDNFLFAQDVSTYGGDTATLRMIP